MSTKVTPEHRTRAAYVYLRQSTMKQVRHHTESTERQYALRGKAVELGWDAATVRTLDGDLGQSGAQSAGRADFQTLVADVSMGKVGAIFALEASRLARSSLDWQRLIRICAVTKTLVVDEDGCYDPDDFNDALLLGLKGTIAQAELHFIRARLQGGILNKAKKGELRFQLPVGFCHEDGKVVVDPDQEVQGAVRMAFAVFRQTGSALGAVRHFAEHGLRFPKRANGGAWDGKLFWGPLTHCRMLLLLRNPTYAGAYVYGRHREQKQASENGEVSSRTVAVARGDWLVTIRDHHPGYVTWDEHLENLRILASNRSNGIGKGPREGKALLQGLALCGRCGRSLSAQYNSRSGLHSYRCRHDPSAGRSACLSVSGARLDAVIAARVPKILEPAQLEIAFEALRKLEEGDATLCRQRELELERAEYDVDLAERRYQQVDPANRLVAATLEQRWNEALVRLDALRGELAEFRARTGRAVTRAQRERVLALAADFPRLWSAPTTTVKDRKRMLRVLIKDVTVDQDAERKCVTLHVRWQGGACEDMDVDMAWKSGDRPAAADYFRYPEEVVERVRELAGSMRDDRVAEALNAEGRVGSRGAPFTWSMVAWIRYCHDIPVPDLKRHGELTVSQVCERLGVKRGVVYRWIASGVLETRRHESGSAHWIVIDSRKQRELERMAERIRA